MQLVVDVGNTETVVGLAQKPTEVSAHWRISSVVPRTSDELTALLRSLLAGQSIDGGGITRGVIGSTRCDSSCRRLPCRMRSTVSLKPTNG